MWKDGPGLEITELRLGLPGGSVVYCSPDKRDDDSRMFPDIRSGVSDKNQAVGWPPVCSYRRKNVVNESHSEKVMYVKVSMDGAPFLRKIDLSTLKSYSDLMAGLEKLFACFGEELNADSREYVPIYEDKDGDWMLVGDVPWVMFIETCKRLRIMKRSEARVFRQLPTRHSFKRDGAKASHEDV